MRFAESHVEEAALGWFRDLGYFFLHGPDTVPGEPTSEREPVKSFFNGNLENFCLRAFGIMRLHLSCLSCSSCQKKWVGGAGRPRRRSGVQLA